MQRTNASQEVWTHPQDAEEIRKLRCGIERLRDFIGWLFDNPDDEGIHWMTESEAWELFEKWEEKAYSSSSSGEQKSST